MRAVQVTASHDVVVGDFPQTPLGPEDVLIAPAACGICGTDRHIAEGDFPGTSYPVVPGHEFSGYVVATGSDAGGLPEGTFVAVNPNVVCGRCRWCRSGHPNLCDHLVAIGVGRPGAAAEFVAVPRSNVFRVSDRLSPSAAALIEPLACVLNALEAGGVVRDRAVLVTGAGTMGLLLTIVAQLAGASVTVSDPSVIKGDVARSLGARTVLPQTLENERYDVVFEASGSVAASSQALGLLEKRGRLVQVGVLGTAQEVAFRPFDLYERELTIVGSNSLIDNFENAADVMVDIAETAMQLITHRFSVWDYTRAIEATMQPGAIKTHLTFSS